MGCLVTGCKGYVGSRIVSFMREQGQEVYSAGRQDFDCSDIEQIRTYFKNKRIDRVIHTASAIEPENLAEYFQTNIVGLYLLLKVCKENNVEHFTFISGNNIYSDKTHIAHSEDESVQPVANNLYGISKYAGELLATDFCGQRGIKIANVRIGDIYGPDQRYGNLMKAIVRSVREGNPLRRHGKGLRTRDYIYISDVVKGLAFISDNRLEGVLNLATGKGTSVNELLEIANQIADGLCPIEDVPCAVEDDSCVILSVDRLKKHGFCTEVDIMEGLKLTIMKDDLKK